LLISELLHILMESTSLLIPLAMSIVCYALNYNHAKLLATTTMITNIYENLRFDSINAVVVRL
jgi:hypothetical protein